MSAEEDGALRYIVYSYGKDLNPGAWRQQEEGQFDDRQVADEFARQAVEGGKRSAHVMRARDGRIVSQWDLEELANLRA